MLSRVITRSRLGVKLSDFRIYSACLQKNSSKIWCRLLTNDDRSDNVKKNSSKSKFTSINTSEKLPISSGNSKSHNSSEKPGRVTPSNLTSDSTRENQPSYEFMDDRKSQTKEQSDVTLNQGRLETSSFENHNLSSHSSKISPSAHHQKEDDSPSYPLPDLTQGIPSTLDYDVNSKSSTSNLNLLDVEQSFQSGEKRTRGSLPASAYISSSERRRLQGANYFYSFFLIFSVFGTLYLGRNWDTEEEEKQHLQAPSGWSISLIWKRVKARVSDELNYFQEPAFRKLLPDVDPMFERPYTLVLALEDLLVYSEWFREHGWRLAKRPGVDYFLRYLSQYYELVVFTTEPSHFAEPILRKLDPYHIIMWPLFREATLYENGEYIKDLSYLNRDPSKVIIIDTKRAHVKKQPENAIILEPWRGDPNDKELISLIPFLEYIHTMAYSDVRKALQSFDGKHIPTEFARREAIARKKFLDQLEEEKKRRPKRSILGILQHVLGIKHQPMIFDPNEQSSAEAFAQGKMLQDQARERGQRNYQLLEKEIRENGEKWLKEEAALEEKSKEESMKLMKSGLTGFLSVGKKNESESQLVK